MKNLIMYCFVLLLLLASCRKDEDTIDINQSSPDPSLTGQILGTENVNAGVRGMIVGPGSSPIPDATIKVGNLTTFTDAYGHFFIEDQPMNAKGTLVTVEKPEYFNGSRLFFPKEGQQSNVKVELLSKVFEPEFEAAEGGTFSFGSYELSVDFPPSSIVKADGSAYDGIVYIAARYLNPAHASVIQQMPGNLLGVDADSQVQALQTFGMLALEMESESGEPLDLAEGSTAQLSMPLPGEMINLAPDQIPLWSYNEASGLWQEESVAYLEDGHYVGEVSHFSLWNCDVPYEMAFIEAILQDENSEPVANTLVAFTRPGLDNLVDSIFVASAATYTDENGYLSGFVPIGQPLLMEPMTPCATPLDVLEIGPFTQDTYFGIVNVGGAETNAITLSGTLICGGNVVEEGLVLVEFNGEEIYQYIDTPNFEFSFATCPFTNSIKVTGINLESMTQGETITISDPEGLQSLGTINTCGGPLENFISITIDDVNHVYLGAEYVQNPEFRYVRAIQDSVSLAIFGCYGFGTGDFSNSGWMEAVQNDPLAWDFDAADFEFDAFYVYNDSPVFSGFMSGIWNDDGTERTVTATFGVDSD